MKLTKHCGLYLAVLFSCTILSCGGTEEPQEPTPGPGTEEPTPTPDPDKDPESPEIPQVSENGPTVPKVTGKTYTASNASEFSAAVAKLVPGDEIVLNSGTWNNTKLTVNKSGTAAKPIVIRAKVNGKTVFTGNSNFTIDGAYIHVSGLNYNGGAVAHDKSSKPYIVCFGKNSKCSTLSNCAFDNFSPSDKSFTDTWIAMNGTYNILEYCYFGNKDNMGLYITVWRTNGKVDNHKIYRNFFYRPNSINQGTNGQETIRIGTSGDSMTESHTTVEGNLFYKCNGEIEIISVKSCNNIIKNNTFLESAGCMTLRHGEGTTVEGNYFLPNNVSGAGGIRVIDGEHKIYNNYFYGLKSSSRPPLSIHMGVKGSPANGYLRCENVVIANNTMVDCIYPFNLGASVSGAVLEAPRNITFTGNLSVSGVSGAKIYEVGSGADIKEMKISSSKVILNNDANEAYERSTMTIAGLTVPKLVAKTTYSAAPAYVKDDISGVLRSATTPIGAISYSAGTPTDAVADKDNCGPNWTSDWVNPLDK